MGAQHAHGPCATCMSTYEVATSSRQVRLSVDSSQLRSVVVVRSAGGGHRRSNTSRNADRAQDSPATHQP
jgi:hypothetical protein